jgi:uncharacterized protein (TIGR00369 family)
MCFVCGVENSNGLKLRFFETGPGEVIAYYTVDKKFQSYPGVVHGGIVAAILDEAAGRSQMGPDANRFMFTAQISVRYRKPVPVGMPLRILGHAQELHGHIAKASGEIYDKDSNLLAQADLILADVPPENLDQFNTSSIGWRLYPEEDPQ